MTLKERVEAIFKERIDRMEIHKEIAGPMSLTDAAKHYKTSRTQLLRVLEGGRPSKASGRPAEGISGRELYDALDRAFQPMTAVEFIEKISEKILALANDRDD